MNANLARNLIASAERFPDRVMLRLDDQQMTYRQLDEATARFAGLLRVRGLRPGDRVGIMLPNVPEFAVVYYGVLRAGGVIVPLNVLFKRREVGYHLGDAGAKLLFAWKGFAEEAELGAAQAGTTFLPIGPGDLARLLSDHPPSPEIAERAPTDTAVILYTSGTTGRPKGAELTHANLGENAQAAKRLFGIDETAVTLGVLPLFHSFGQTCGLNTTILTGSTFTMVARFTPEKALEVIERDRVGVFQGVPTMYGALLHSPERARFDASTLRLCVSGGASLPVELMRAFEKAFGCMIIEGYGLSETSPIASFNHTDRERKPGSIGTPIAGVEMRLVGMDGAPVARGEVGEIQIRGHNVMKGYWGKPEATAEAISADGWFRSGDLARMDDDGYYYIVDRMKDMIIRGGFNVYPREVEEVLFGHPAVREAVVIGVPHEELGEEIAAAVVLKQGSGTGADELREFVKAQIAAYKYPRHIWFVDELPKTATGKVLKREIQVPPELGRAR